MKIVKVVAASPCDVSLDDVALLSYVCDHPFIEDDDFWMNTSTLFAEGSNGMGKAVLHGGVWLQHWLFLLSPQSVSDPSDQRKRGLRPGRPILPSQSKRGEWRGGGPAVSLGDCAAR